ADLRSGGRNRCDNTPSLAMSRPAEAPSDTCLPLLFQRSTIALRQLLGTFTLTGRAEAGQAEKEKAKVAAELLTFIEGSVARIRLNRPRSLHALNQAMCDIMIEALLAWAKDPAVKAVLIDH